MINITPTDAQEIVRLVSLGESANATDNELLDYARKLIEVSEIVHANLDAVQKVLIERKGYIDGVLWQIAGVTRK